MLTGRNVLFSPATQGIRANTSAELGRLTSLRPAARNLFDRKGVDMKMFDENGLNMPRNNSKNSGESTPNDLASVNRGRRKRILDKLDRNPCRTVRTPPSLELLEDRSLMTANAADILIDALPVDWWTTINPVVSLPSIVAPTAPSGINAPGEAFDPSSAGINFNGNIPANAPIISEWTRTADQDESISISGDNFSSFQGGKTKFFVFADAGAGPGRIFEATTQSVQGDNRAIITLPRSGIPAGSMYMIWAADDDGVSRPVFVNRTEAWWIGPNAGQAGQRISIYGRNLSQSDQEWKAGVSAGTAPAWVWIAPQAGGPAVQVQVTEVNPYRVEFQLPGNLAAGNYRAWVHNGKGGNLGWGAPLDFTVRSAADNGSNWSGPTFDMSNTPELAQIQSNGSADDAALIQTVLTRASQTPFATVILPSGTFYLDSRINLPSRMRLLGQGMNQTILQARANPNFNGIGLLFSDSGGRSSNNVSFENFTLHSGYNPLQPGDTSYTGGIEAVVKFFGQSDVTFRGVRFDSRVGDGVFFGGCTRITLQNCEFYGQEPLFFTGSTQTFVDGCNFFLTNLGGAAISHWGGEQTSTTNCTAQSLDPSNPNNTANWGLRLFVNSHGGRHKYFAHNTTRNLGLPPSAADNIGEQFLWEGATSIFQGRPTSWTANTVTFSQGLTNIDFSDGRRYINVVQNQGVGQNRRILGATVVGNQVTLTLESPLTVQVDTTSEISILWQSEKCVVYNNDLNGLVENANRDTYIGPTGIMLYTGTSDFIIDSNRFTDIRQSIAIYSYTETNLGYPSFEPSTHIIVSNNTIRNARYAMVYYSYGGAAMTSNPLGREKSGLLGNVFRGNTIINASKSGLDVVYQRRNGELPAGDIIDNLIIEHNSFQDTPTAINFALGLTIDFTAVAVNEAIVRDALVYKNILTRNTVNPTLVDPGSKGIIVGMGQSVSLIDNIITGFDESVAGDTPILVRKTGNPNEFTFTVSGRDLDRKSSSFYYEVDWNGDGLYDRLSNGQPRILAGDTYTFTYQFTNPNVNPSFIIRTLTDSRTFEYKLKRWGDTFVPVESSPISTAILAGPTANAREYSFTVFVDNFMAPGRAVNIALDLNGNGNFTDPGELKVGVTSAQWNYTFPTAVGNNVYYKVWDQAGHATTGMISIDSSRRDILFEGSDREDWIRFREPTAGNVAVDITRINGRAVNISQTFSNITGWISAAGNAGPDVIDGSQVTTRPIRMFGGADSDILLGGASNDIIKGGDPPDRLPSMDGPNWISGGGGQNTISSTSLSVEPIASINLPPAAPTNRLDGFSFGSLFETTSAGSQNVAWKAALDLTFANLPPRSVGSISMLENRFSNPSSSTSTNQDDEEDAELFEANDDADRFDVVWSGLGK
jgi:hypothetical protein